MDERVLRVIEVDGLTCAVFADDDMLYLVGAVVVENEGDDPWDERCLLWRACAPSDVAVVLAELPRVTTVAALLASDWAYDAGS